MSHPDLKRCWACKGTGTEVNGGYMIVACRHCNGKKFLTEVNENDIQPQKIAQRAKQKKSGEAQINARAS